MDVSDVFRITIIYVINNNMYLKLHELFMLFTLNRELHNLINIDIGNIIFTLNKNYELELPKNEKMLSRNRYYYNKYKIQQSLNLSYNNSITNNSVSILTNLTKLNLYCNNLITDNVISMLTNLTNFVEN